MNSHHSGSNWIDLLSDEDLAFVKRFVLASGSLKAMAKAECLIVVASGIADATISG